MLKSVDPSSASATRVLRHPGSPRPERHLIQQVERSQTRTVIIPDGKDLFETLQILAQDAGAPGAAFALVRGDVRMLDLMTGGGTADHLPSFVGPHTLQAPLSVVAGAGNVGVDEKGALCAHAHCVFQDLSGKVVGGHIISGHCIAGAAGIEVEMTLIRLGHFVRRLDDETRFTIFHPSAIQ